MKARAWSFVAAGCAGAFAAVTARAGAAAPGTAARTATKDTVVAAVVMTPGSDAKTNRRRTETLIARAAAAGASMIALPELALASRPAPGRELIAHAIPGPSVDEAADVARLHGVAVVTSVLERANGTDEFFVAPILVDRAGEFLFHSRKVMPSAGPADARFVRGDAAAVLESLEVDGRRVGVLAGDDLMPGVARLAARGAGIIFVTGDWARDPSPPAAIRDQLTALSRRYRVHLVVAGARGAIAGVYRYDTSVRVAVDDDGVAVASLPGEPPSAVMPAALGLPEVPVPRTARASAAQIELGRQLFVDPALSRTGRVSCATCHQPDRAFTTGAPTTSGVDAAERNARNVPTLLNVGFRGALFWDGSSALLEHQAKFPMNHPLEMDRPYFDVVAWVARQPRYVAEFHEIGVDAIDFDAIAGALASYQRSLVSGNSPFDRYFYRGDREALSDSAVRGLQVFRSKGRCSTCHTLGPRYALFSDQRYHNTGVGFAGGEFRDLGLGGLAHGGSRRAGFFLTPSLRNVALTAPYMHDGSLPTLAAVVDFYERGGHANPSLDPDLHPLRLTPEERVDLVAFLESLTGDARYAADGRRLAPATITTVPVAAVQFTPVEGDVDANARALADLVREAASHARVIALPEHALTGRLPRRPTPEWIARIVADVDAARTVFVGIARDRGLWIGFPSLALDGAGEYRHAIDWLTPSGERVQRTEKLRPRHEFGDGAALPGSDKTLLPIDTPFGRIGATSGHDVAATVAQLAERGTRIVLVSASWQAGDGVEWLPLVAGLARTHRVAIAVANLRDGSGEPFGALIDVDGQLVRRDESPTLPIAIVEADVSVITSGQAAALGLPPVPVPAAAPITAEGVAIGHDLFFDPVLSRDRAISCATCHDPARAFADGHAVAIGVHGRRGTRNVPTLLNAAFRPFYAWDGGVPTLEEQVLRALRGWSEMDADCSDRVPALEADASYRRRFQAWTGRDVITPRDVSGALAQYVRTLVSGDSPFDRYYFRGERDAIRPAAQRGFSLFTGKARCATCHLVGRDSALFTDNAVHNTGIGYHPRFEYLGYAGDGLAVNLARVNRFRGEYMTPTLRNVGESAPYMHDGSLATLEDVVRFYDRGGIGNPFLDPRITPLGLTDDEQRDLVAFLRALTGTPRIGATP